MSAFSDRIQNFAKKEVEAGNTKGVIKDVALNKEGFGGDQLEKAKKLYPLRVICLSQRIFFTCASVKFPTKIL